MTEQMEKTTTETLLEKIPAETRLALGAEFLTRFCILRGEQIIAPAMGKVEGVTAPVLGFEKWLEINEQTWTEGIEQYFLWIKETFNILVEDTIGAAKVYVLDWALAGGPECVFEIVEATPKRSVVRWTQCSWRKRYKEEGVPPEFIACCNGCHQENSRKGLKALNPKLTRKFTKLDVKGDPYCEIVIELKND